MLESAIVAACLKALRAHGAWAEKIHGSAHQPAVIDILACYRGQFVGIEVKQPGKKPTPRQAHTLAEIKRAEGWAFVVDSPDGVEALIREIDVAILMRWAITNHKEQQQGGKSV